MMKVQAVCRCKALSRGLTASTAFTAVLREAAIGQAWQPVDARAGSRGGPGMQCAETVLEWGTQRRGGPKGPTWRSGQTAGELGAWGSRGEGLRRLGPGTAPRHQAGRL